MLLSFAKSVSHPLSFPRKRESSGNRYVVDQLPDHVSSRHSIFDARSSRMGWIPACAGMTRMAGLSLLFLILVSGITGCASTGSSESGTAAPVSNPVPVSPAPSGDVEEQHRTVLSLMQQEDWQGALDLLEPITEAHPDLSGAWTNLGITRVKLGDSDGAEAAFKRALATDAANDVACNQLGMLYRRSGRHDAARDSYLQGIAANPDNANLHWNLAILHEQYLPEPALALAHFERYQALSGSDDAQLQRWIVELREQAPPPETLKAEAKK